MGAVIVTVDEVVDVTTAVGAPGAPGAAMGVTAVEAAEAAEVPIVLVAVEVKVYAVPLVRPVTVHDSGEAEDSSVQVAPPGDAVTVYESAAPPDDGATTVTTAWPSPAIAVGVPGAPGAIAAEGMTALEADEADEVPMPFVAVDVKVYDVPEVSDGTTHEVAGTVTVHVEPPGAAVTV